MFSFTHKEYNANCISAINYNVWIFRENCVGRHFNNKNSLFPSLSLVRRVFCFSPLFQVNSFQLSQRCFDDAFFCCASNFLIKKVVDFVFVLVDFPTKRKCIPSSWVLKLYTHAHTQSFSMGNKFRWIFLFNRFFFLSNTLHITKYYIELPERAHSSNVQTNDLFAYKYCAHYHNCTQTKRKNLRRIESSMCSSSSLPCNG